MQVGEHRRAVHEQSVWLCLRAGIGEGRVPVTGRTGIGGLMIIMVNLSSLCRVK